MSVQLVSDGGLETFDFMGLGLVSVSSLKGQGLARDYSIESTRPEEKKNENRGMKKAQKCFLFCFVEKYLSKKILCLGIGF